MYQFPKEFFWGAATSSHQVEGNNIYNDWWEWERRVSVKEPSGAACRHYELYQEDFDLAKSLNHNAHRLSIEWSRIEPEEGKFSLSEIGHYRKVIRALKERNLEPIVTLHHFTSPLWFAKIGGWQNKRAGEYFLRYAQKIVEVLAGEVRFWVTINEPLIYVYFSYLLGDWPPQEKSLFKARSVAENLIAGHVKVYRRIHSLYREKSLPSPLVSIAKNTQAFVPCQDTPRNRFAVYFRDRYFNHDFIKRLIKQKALDFIGINYYSRSLVETRGWGVRNIAMDTCESGHSKLAKNSLGWDVYPQGLYDILLGYKRYNLPLFILENGICTPDDNLRRSFIYEHLKSVSLALEKGVNILGYIYWSLLDNYEWDKGFAPRFGLIDVNYSTYQRTVRESAKKFSEICLTGRLP